jgi:hypothetical protein
MKTPASSVESCKASARPRKTCVVNCRARGATSPISTA